MKNPQIIKKIAGSICLPVLPLAAAGRLWYAAGTRRAMNIVCHFTSDVLSAVSAASATGEIGLATAFNAGSILIHRYLGTRTAHSMTVLKAIS